MEGEAIKVYLSHPGVDCVVCGAATDWALGVPVWEDVLLPNDWEGDWGGFGACRECFEYQESLTHPVPVIAAAKCIQQRRNKDAKT